MDWILRSPQIHSIFSNLGYVHADIYHVSEDCDAALESILNSILNEDKSLQTFRRSISFGENVKKDLIPLLIHAKEDKTISLITKILLNLTVPIECLIAVDVVSQTDFGRHKIFELNNLLTSIKMAFADDRVTKVIIGFVKKNAVYDQKARLLPEQCTNIKNCLLLLRNILHIPENRNARHPNYSEYPHMVQNQIIWNIFSQNIDKVLIKLMTIPEARYWGVSLIQFIGLMYKDQHVLTLHTLLDTWLETSLSESSEDNESNTPLDQGSDDSSAMLTSDPTSDSSDTGADTKPNSMNCWEATSDKNTRQNENDKHVFVIDDKQDYTNDVTAVIENNAEDTTKSNNDASASSPSDTQSEQTEPAGKRLKKKMGISEASDCGYGTQIDNQETISTSSNDDDLPPKRPRYLKQRPYTKVRSGTSHQDRKRKKTKRGKPNIIVNVRGLTHKTPTDEDVTNILKEFTVDFLTKGYNSLIGTLHDEILTNKQVEIDTSHFFWLLTYFLKFATRIELDMYDVNSVLSFDLASYLTAEGVNLCEQFELAVKIKGKNLAPTIKRQHLIVTAIRELIQAVNDFKKDTGLSQEDQDALLKLKIKICDTEELRSLFVLLIRHYNPKYHYKQYLQDIIVTNHLLLTLLDNVRKLPEYTGPANMVDHLRQFATLDVMRQYGMVLENFTSNGEFLNDCIFTVMHHVSREPDGARAIFQPKILKTFATIRKKEYELSEEWNDLVEYGINSSSMKPNSAQFITDGPDDDMPMLIGMSPPPIEEINELEAQMELARTADNSTNERWTEDEISSLSWTYMQCKSLPDVIGEIMKLLKEDDIVKSKDSVISELYKQDMIDRDDYKKFMKGDSDTSTADSKDVGEENVSQDEEDVSKGEDNVSKGEEDVSKGEDNVSKGEENASNGEEDVSKGEEDVSNGEEDVSNDEDVVSKSEEEVALLCLELAEEGKSKFLDWVQKVLLETCYAKIYLAKRKLDKSAAKGSKLLNFEVFKKWVDEIPLMSPVSYHALMLNMSVPLVTWNYHQASICKDPKFRQLLNTLGFEMPVDSESIFIRIPYSWTADFMYGVAEKIAPVDISKLNFAVNEFAETSAKKAPEAPAFSDVHDTDMVESEDFYQVEEHTHFASMVNFTPMPVYSYKSEASETHHDWLKVVQKSQEFKRILNSYSSEKIGESTKTRGELPSCLTPEPAAEKYLSVGHTNSIRETPCVTSNLMHEYDSDEDEMLETRAAARARAYADFKHGKPKPYSKPCSDQPRQRSRISFSSLF